MAATAKLKKQSGVRVIPTVFDNESHNQGTLKPACSSSCQPAQVHQRHRQRLRLLRLRRRDLDFDRAGRRLRAIEPGC